MKPWTLTTFFAVGLLAVASTGASAQTKAQPDTIANCNLQRIHDQRELDHIRVAADNAQMSRPILEELERLNNKGTDPTKPIGAQLSLPDAQRFVVLSQRLKYLQVITYFEDARSRDAHVIYQMSRMALALYNGASPPARDDPAEIYWVALEALRMMFPPETIKITVPPRFRECTYEWAIHLLEEKSIERLNQLHSQIVEAHGQLDEILRKQGRTTTEGIDQTRLSPREKALIADIQRTVMLPASREQAYIADMENLKSLAAASEIMYALNKQDFIRTGGDGNAVGSSIAKGHFDNKTKVMFGMWDRISKKEPTETAKQLRAVGDAATKVQGKSR